MGDAMELGALLSHLRTVRSELQQQGRHGLADRVLKALAELEQVEQVRREMTWRDDSLGM